MPAATGITGRVDRRCPRARPLARRGSLAGPAAGRPRAASVRAESAPAAVLAPAPARARRRTEARNRGGDGPCLLRRPGVTHPGPQAGPGMRRRLSLRAACSPASPGNIGPLRRRESVTCRKRGAPGLGGFCAKSRGPPGRILRSQAGPSGQVEGRGEARQGRRGGSEAASQAVVHAAAIAVGACPSCREFVALRPGPRLKGTRDHVRQSITNRGGRP